MAALLSVSGAALATAGTASAVSTATSTRVAAGVDRFDTAAQIAEKTFPSGAATAVLASGDAGHFADALAGNYLAGALGAPILLTTLASTPSETLTALTTLKVKTIDVIGGTSAVSAAQVSALQAAGYAVNQISGADRYATDSAVDSYTGTTVGTFNGLKTAIIASGGNFPDALAAGSLSYSKHFPVILVVPGATLSTAASTELTSLGIQQVIIAGGTTAVSAAQETAINALGAKTLYRAAGADRTATSQLLGDFAIQNGLLGSTQFVVANGSNAGGGADALAGGPYAGVNSEPILVTADPNTPGAVSTFATEHAGSVTNVNILGGTAAISAATATAITTAAQSASGSATTRPELSSAVVVSTTTTATATPTNLAGTVVQYSFNKDVSAFTPVAGDFKVYTGGDTAIVGTSIISQTGTTVNVDFASTTNATVNTAAGAATLTAATVVPGAVKGANGQTNPEGAASLNSTSASNTTGATIAPDLLSVGNFRAAAGAGFTAADFTFDAAAYATTAGATGFHLILVDGTELTGQVAATTTVAGGGTSPGGDGTTVVTAIFPNEGATTYVAPTGTTPAQFTGNAGTQSSAATVARGEIDAGSVTDSSTGTGGDLNPLEAATVSNSGNTVLPDLLSATFEPESTTGNTGYVLYTFDAPITGTPVAADFHIDSAAAATTNGENVTTATTASPYLSPQIGSSNADQVLVAFPTGTVGSAVAASVSQGAVTSNGIPQTDTTYSNAGVVTPGTAGTNQPDEVAVVTSSNQTAGSTAGPDLTAVALVSGTDAFNAATYTATYTFDATLATAPVAADYHLYLADGTELNASTVTIASNGTSVTASGFVLVGGTGAGTAAQVGSAVLGTVSTGAATVTGGLTNPEGAKHTTGAIATTS
jgi:putative cell wall-binding protein